MAASPKIIPALIVLAVLFRRRPFGCSLVLFLSRCRRGLIVWRLLLCQNLRPGELALAQKERAVLQFDQFTSVAEGFLFHDPRLGLSIPIWSGWHRRQGWLRRRPR